MVILQKREDIKMKIEKCGNITLINGDCMEFMQSQSENLLIWQLLTRTAEVWAMQ